MDVNVGISYDCFGYVSLYFLLSVELRVISRNSCLNHILSVSLGKTQGPYDTEYFVGQIIFEVRFNVILSFFHYFPIHVPVWL